MTLATVTGSIANASGLPPGTHVRVVAYPADAVIAGATLLVKQGVEAAVNQATGEWSVDLIPSSVTGKSYKFRTWWLGPNPGSELWPMNGNSGVFIPPSGGPLDALIPGVEVNLRVWEGSTPPAVSMWWLYVSSDGATPYITPSGALIQHGDLVDWRV